MTARKRKRCKKRRRMERMRESMFSGLLKAWHIITLIWFSLTYKLLPALPQALCLSSITRDACQLRLPLPLPLAFPPLRDYATDWFKSWHLNPFDNVTGGASSWRRTRSSLSCRWWWWWWWCGWIQRKYDEACLQIFSFFKGKTLLERIIQVPKIATRWDVRRVCLCLWVGVGAGVNPFELK